MAKGNLFLGMGRGKVGDVVFYRMNGWQMARVRNRNPKNPRSNEQLYQRAVIATTMKAYSMGKEIFDHAFQGQTIGEGCMRRFNSVNARILRSQLISDIQNATPINDQIGRFCSPKSITGTPVIGLQVSEGTLTNNLIKSREAAGFNEFYLNAGADLTLQQVLDNNNTSSGDIYTFVYMMANKDVIEYENAFFSSDLARKYETKFGWMRFTIKDNLKLTEKMTNLRFSDMFDIEWGGDIVVRFEPNKSFADNQAFIFNFGLVNYGGVMACIRSRNDMDLRSTEFMVPYHSSDYGIASSYVLPIWVEDVTKVGESELILEGGEAEGISLTAESPSGQPEMGLNDDVIVNSPEEESPLRRRGRTKA